MNQFHPFFKRFSVFIFILFIFSFLHSTKATSNQSETGIIISEDTVYSIVDKMPEFPGGEKALIGFLNKSIEYPAEAQKKNEQGKVVVQFVINKTGKVENAKVIRGVSPSLDAEALRVIGLLPDWIPGEKNGEKVSVYRILPITFQNLTEEERWTTNEKTVIIIDSVKMPVGFNTNILNPDKLISLTVLKPFPKEEKEKLMKKYGRQAADGVILIYTKKNELEYSLADSISNLPDGCKQSDVIPQFNGGKQALDKFISDSIQYPFVAKRLKTEGKVIVKFLVDKIGKVSGAKIVRSVDYFLDKEALRVVSIMPDWIPGAKCGQKANIWVTMPVTFKLELPAAEKAWERNDKTIILLDGVRLPSMFNLDWLNYTALTSYQVLQPSSKEVVKKLVSQYGKDATNGVIVIGTKK